MQSINKQMSVFLFDLVGSSKWSEIVLNIEIQPGVLGMDGYFLDEHSNKKSLRTKPTDQLREIIHKFHLETAKDELSKWNRYRIRINQNSTIDGEFIWDSKWQDEIDKLNTEAKERNPNYVLPKWHWEK